MKNTFLYLFLEWPTFWRVLNEFKKKLTLQQSLFKTLLDLSKTSQLLIVNIWKLIVFKYFDINFKINVMRQRCDVSSTVWFI